MKILFVGDIHGHIQKLNKLIFEQEPDIVIQCGDNAVYWAKEDRSAEVEPGNSKVYFLPGNHEDWELFDFNVGRNGRDPVEIQDNVYMCPLGSTLKVNDTNILFCGGAESIDKAYRTIGFTWFEEECFQKNDLDYILKEYHELELKNIDIIASHTCPESFLESLLPYNHLKIYDPSYKYLEKLLHKTNPEYWFFGHWHVNDKGIYKSLKNKLKTEWRALHTCSYVLEGWYYILEI